MFENNKALNKHEGYANKKAPYSSSYAQGR